MLILVKLIGAYIIFIGIIFLLKPKLLKGYIAFWDQGKRLYIIGGSRLLMGTILLSASSQCRLKWVVLILSILIIIAGLPYFIMKKERMQVMLSRWDKRPTLFIRLLGLSILAIGALLIYSA